MEIKVPNLPNWAWWGLAALAVYGVNRGFSDVARGARNVASDLVEGVGDVIEDAGELFDDAADEVKRKWKNAGEGTRAALPWVVAGTALILWKKG